METQSVITQPMMKTSTLTLTVAAIIAAYPVAQYSAGYFLTKHDISQAKKYCGEPCSTSEAKFLLEQTESRPLRYAGYRQAAQDYLNDLAQRP